METTNATKVRYFIFGLMICLLSSPHLFQLLMPAGIKHAQIWINVHTAVTGGSFVVLVIGALGGFALSRKVLSPIRTLMVSLIVGFSIIGLMMTDVAEAMGLGAVVGLSFIVGFLGCWAVIESFGVIPGHSSNKVGEATKSVRL